MDSPIPSQQDTTGNEDGGLGSLGSDDLLMIIIGGAVILVVLLMAYYITRRMRSLKTTGMTGIAKMAPGTVSAGQRQVILDTFGAPNNGWGFILAGDFPTQVIWVDVGSLADFCGLRVGDTILQINGRDVSNMTKSNVVEALKLFSVRAVLVVQQIRTLALQGTHTGESRIDASPLAPMASPSQQPGVTSTPARALNLNLTPGKKDGPMFDKAYTGENLPPAQRRVNGSPQASPAPAMMQNKRESKRSPKKEVRFNVGDRVEIQGYSTPGVVRYFGPHADASKGNRVLVELDVAEGKNNGTVNGHFYAKVPEGTGVLTIATKLSTSTIPLSEKQDAPPAAATSAASPKKANAASSSSSSNSSSSGGGDGGGGQSNAAWHHTKDFDQAECIRFVDAHPDGTFLISNRPNKKTGAAENVMCLKYNSKATFHKIAKASDGVYEVTGKRYGLNARSIAELVEALSKDSLPPGWPIKLGNGISESGDVVGRTGAAPAPPPVVEADDSQEWLVNKMTDDSASKFLVGKAPGTFFVRDLYPGKGEYTISVAADEKVSAHYTLVAQDGVAATVDGKKLPVEGLSAAIMHLRSTYDYWSVALKDHLTVADVEVAEEADDEEAPPPRPPREANGVGASAGASSSKTPWLVEKMSNGEAFAKLEGKPNGTFMVRNHTPEDGIYALSVVYKDKPTHHKVTAPAGEKAKVNKAVTTVEGIVEVVEHLREKQRYWPIPLTDHVPGAAQPEPAPAPAPEPEPEPEPEPISTSASATIQEEPEEAPAASAPSGDEPWLHEKMSNDEAFAKLEGKPNGTFMIRKHTPTQGIYALSVVYKDKPTHHKVLAPAGEKAKVNKAMTTVEGIVEVVAHLREKQKYWPIPLGETVPKGSGVGDSGSVGDGGSAPAAPAPAAPAAPADVVPDLPEAKQPWLHQKMSNDEAVIFLEGSEDGTFMVREHTPDEGVYAMSVVYKGKPTHHKIRAPKGGKTKINTAETPAETLDELVEHLREKRKYWPVPLKDHVKQSKTRGSIKRRKSSSKKKKGSVKSKGAASKAGDDSKQLWLHQKLHNDDAGELLVGKPDGHFLVRMHTPAESLYALSVVYKGKPTHHKLKAPDGEDATVGRAKAPVQGISAVVTHLRERHPYWPVPLTEHVAGNAKAGEDKDAWLHPKMSNKAAESMLGDGEDGTFMIRSFKEDEGQYVISVMYSGKPTHHLLKANEGLINNKIAVTSDGVEAVVKQLRGPTKGWPVALGTHIPATLDM